MTTIVTTTITMLDDERLIREGEAACERYTRSRHEILPMARGLLAARRKFPADTEFGTWLAGSPYNQIGKTDRADLINLGEHERETTAFLRGTHLTSPRLIWGIVKDMLPVSHVGKPTPNSELASEASNTNVPGPESQKASVKIDIYKSDPVKLAALLKNKPDSAKKRVGPPSPLFGLPRADEVTAITNQDLRTLLGKVAKERGGMAVWNLILQAMDAGLVHTNARTFRTPEMSFWFIFPEAPKGFARRFDITNPKIRQHVANEMLPAMIACRDQLLAKPDNIQEILNAYYRSQRKEAVRKVEDQRRVEAIAGLAPGETEIVIFGQTLWPRLDNRQGEYDYDQIRAAIWSFRDLNAWNRQITQDNSLGSCAVRIRLSMKWYGEYLIRHDPQRINPMRKIINLVQYITRLMEAAPDAECKWPAYPTTEAEW